MEIIDNFLPPEEFYSIQEVVFAEDFPWHFCDFVLKYDPQISFKKDEYQFTHLIYADKEPRSTTFNIFKESVIRRLNIDFLLKLKLNLNPITETHKYKDLFHVDQSGETGGKRKTAVFYLNTNNGYTLFEDGKKVDCVENRIAIFDSDKKHTGVTTTDTQCKIVLNINWLE